MNRFALTESFAPCQVYGCRLHRLSFRCIEDVWLDIDRVTEYIHLTFKVVLDGECVDCHQITYRSYYYNYSPGLGSAARFRERSFVLV